MDELEKVERLREKAQVSYEEAKNALEECGGDLLEAMVYLEKQGKVKQPEQTSYTTQYEEPEKIEQAAQETKSNGGFLDMLNRFFAWCGSMIKKGNETNFKVDKQGETIVSIPVTLFVILMIVGWHLILVLMVIGLFIGCRYSFDGAGSVNVDLNKAMDSAADVAESIKGEFKGKDKE